MDKKTVVIGVIGADAHAVGNKIIDLTLTNHGFNVVNLGVMVSQEEFIEAGLKGMPLFVGGNLVVGKQNFEDVKERFLSMGFDYVYAPSTPIEETIVDLNKVLGIE